jgi:copper chaperone CopZ
MRKIALFAVALALTAGTAAYSLACDHDKASSASASASCGEKASTSTTQLTSAGGDGCAAHKNASAGSACSAHKGSNANAVAAECKDGDVADAVFSIADIHGECCVKGVQTAFSKVKNVRYVKVDVASKKAYVCTRGAKLDRKAALKSLKNAGYETASYVGTDKSYKMAEATKKASS